jgi:membrane protease YdiL (CAAX protease family)
MPGLSAPGLRVPERELEPTVPPPPPGWGLTRGPEHLIGADPSAGTARRPGTPWAAVPGLGLGVVAIAFLIHVAAQVVVAQLVIAAVSVWRWLNGGSDTGALPFELVAAAAVLSFVLALVLIRILLRRRDISIVLLVGIRQPLARLLGLGISIGVGALVLSSLLGAILVRLTGSDARPEQLLLSGLDRGPVALLLVAIAAVVLAPMVEEVLFRALLFRTLRRHSGFAVAAFTSASVFAVLHTEVAFSQPLALVGILVLGVLLAAAYERTGSLIVTVVAHAAFNGATLAAVLATSAVGV